MPRKVSAHWFILNGSLDAVALLKAINQILAVDVKQNFSKNFSKFNLGKVFLIPLVNSSGEAHQSKRFL